jgi:tripartite ATP-independent transporter DctP family solute receptor
MKKISKAVWVLLASLVLGLLVTGCSGSKDTAKKADDTKVYKMRIATVVSPPHPWVNAAEFFVKEVDKRTNGKVKITVHHSASLGSDETVIDEMRIGTVDFLIGGTQNAASFIPQYQIFGFSYLFKDMAHFERAIAKDSPVFKAFDKLYVEKKIKLKLLALAGGGTRNVSNNLRPIKEPQDIAGMKMRVPGSPIEGKLWSALGALPNPMPWSEIYSAVQQGVVNAFESTISGYTSSKLYEVAPYHSKTEHLYMATHITVSQTSYDKLPAQYRKVIDEVAVETAKVATESGKKFDEQKLAELPKLKVKVNEVNKAAFIQKLAPLHDAFAKEVNATDILAAIRKLQ